MGMFRDKLCQMMPVVKREYGIKRELKEKIQYAYIEGNPEGNYYEIPYLRPIGEFCQITGNVWGKRIFLVSEEETLGIKAALSILRYPIYEEWDEICNQAELAGYEQSDIRLTGEDGLPLRVRVIEMRGEKMTDAPNNSFLSKVESVEPKENVFFYGLEEGVSLGDKLEVIMSCPAGVQFVLIRKEQLESPWLRDLMMDRESEVIQLPVMESTYYEEVLAKLLEDERYCLAEDVKPAGFVRSLQKKRGHKFAEEDLAWSLAQAAKKVRWEGRYTLGRADFSFEQWEEESALQRLRSMTGLDGMKKQALECAALACEQARNKKLMDICRHAIFKGNPGTGKTICAKLLAQVLEEYGQSSGSLVMAARKDIIGEYVGQTAPKITKLFEKSRNGVLFVDEAGFFLQDVRSGFVHEAVKEFVRYMELYQDVTVIFALYPGEVEEWLKLDAGLSSRIGRIVEFADYSEGQLLEIAEKMCADRGYKLKKNAVEVISGYIVKRKEVLKENFGNAREVRKLVESAIVARSIRCFGKEPKEKYPMLTGMDFENGADRLQEEVQKKDGTKKVGFVLPGGQNGDV